MKLWDKGHPLIKTLKNTLSERTEKWIFFLPNPT